MKAFVMGMGIVISLAFTIITLNPPMIRCQVAAKDNALVEVCKPID
jgi:hypothetical protein